MDINELIAYLFTPAAQIGIIIGLAEIVKKIGLKSKFIPLFDLGFGIILSTIVYTVIQGFSPWHSILIGMFLGLSACGLFSGIKNIVERNDENGISDDGQ